MRRWFVAVTTAVVLTLTACSASDDDPGPTPEPTTEAAVETPTPSPDPSPTETAAEGPVDRSDPELGITFEDLPEVSGPGRAAVDAYTHFEVEFWRSMSTGSVSPELGAFVNDDVRRIVEAQVDGNAERGWSVDGDLHIRFVEVTVTENVVVIDTCQSMDDVVFTSADEELTGPEAGFGHTIIRAEVVSAAGPWLVGTYTDRGEPC